MSVVRLYVPSTPASRGEQEPEVAEQTATVEEVAAQAEALGFKLVPIEAEVDAPVVGEGEQPKGNASREEWVKFARSKGATDADLVDKDGKDLGQKALREKYGVPSDGAEQPTEAPAANKARPDDTVKTETQDTAKAEQDAAK